MLPQRWWCLSSHNLAKWVVFSGKLYLSSLLTVHIMCTNYIEQSALRYAFFMINVFTIYWLLMSRWVSPIQGKKQTEDLPSKPKKWGYKILVLAGSDGVPYNLEIYTGRVVQPPELADVGASGNVVLRLAQPIPKHKNYKDFSTTGLRVSLLCLHWLSREFTALVLFVATDYQVSTWCAMLSWKEQDVDLLNRRWPWWEKPPCML